ncbi:dITP/XTP pyrophosphatase [Propionibacterium freudenreichii]|nr:dITP/XTP pyrophosphatase [Propionibacterium freudenreichii]
MTSEVLLATNNAKKLTELRRIIVEYDMDIQVLSLKDIASYPEPEETEWTFQGNALIKARQGMIHSGLPALADDSGLCVDALGHMPGVRSSRWDGPEQEDIANMELVLRQIEDVPRGRRQAQFVSVMALVMPDGREFTTRGEMTGHLTTRPKLPRIRLRPDLRARRAGSRFRGTPAHRRRDVGCREGRDQPSRTFRARHAADPGGPARPCGPQGTRRRGRDRPRIAELRSGPHRTAQRMDRLHPGGRQAHERCQPGRPAIGRRHPPGALICVNTLTCSPA